jgi:hypothetical protein
MAAATPAPVRRPPIHVGSILKSSTETVKVRLTAYGGHDLVDLRVFDVAGYPTKAGVSVQVEHLPAVLDAVEAAIGEAHRRGLLRKDLVPDRLRPKAPVIRKRARAAS